MEFRYMNNTKEKLCLSIYIPRRNDQTFYFIVYTISVETKNIAITIVPKSNSECYGVLK